MAPPATGKMFKGLLVCYTIISITFYAVAIPGYYVFGNKSGPNILENFLSEDGPSLAPEWVLAVAVVFILLQLFAIGLVNSTNSIKLTCFFFST